MKRVLIALAIVLIVVLTSAIVWQVDMCDEKSYQHATTISTLDFDGANVARTSNAIVIYTIDFPRNQFGYELLVEKDTGFVVDKGEQVQLEKGTFVVSGHGDAVETLQSVQLGDILQVQFGSIVVKHDAVLSPLKALELQADNFVQGKIDGLYDIDYQAIEQVSRTIEQKMQEVVDYAQTENSNPEQLQAKSRELTQLLTTKCALAMESQAVDGRGMWHRPNASAFDETNLDGVKQFVARLYELGINNLYVETLWHGMTTYHSEVLHCQHPRMQGNDYGEYGNDYTLALISECHKLGIEVHAWVELLTASSYYGVKSPSIKSEWVYADLDGNKQGYLDASNPEVQSYLANILTEMLQKYNFDGVSYDYIRYDASPYEGDYADCGFTDHAIATFSAQYDYTGSNLAQDLREDTHLREKWHNFKRAQITNTVKNLTQLVRNVAPEVIISASPYGYMFDAYHVYMQDVETWLQNGYLDVVLPMIYTQNVDVLVANAQKFDSYHTSALQYTGISPLYNGDTILKNQQLVNAIKMQNISGVSLFASQNYLVKKDAYAQFILQTMTLGTHKVKAVSPTADIKEVFSAWTNQLQSRFERIYAEHMTATEKQTLQAFLQSASGASDVDQMLALVSSLQSDIQSFSNNTVKNRIAEQAEYVHKILTFAKARASRVA